MTVESADHCDALEQLTQLIGGAERIFVLSGAGLSTESGIADFRGPTGLWTQNPTAMRMFDIDAYRAEREVRVASWRMRLDSEIRRARPNAGHLALAALQRTKQVVIATQNIDGLHQRAGAQQVLELHGTFWQSMCLDCDSRGPIEDVFARITAGEEDPPCAVCGGILRTATVAFGQSLDAETWLAAVSAARDCDVALAIGTSLSVQPAASLCDRAVASGARLAVINEQPTDADTLASVLLHERIGPTLSAVTESLGLPLG